MTINAEREVKLNAPRKFELPDLHELGLGAVRLPVQSLSTSYFDTEDLRLWNERSRSAIGSGKTRDPDCGR